MTDANREWDRSYGRSWGAERDSVRRVTDRLPAQCPECRQQGCGLTGEAMHETALSGWMEYHERRQCDACGAGWMEVYECMPGRAIAFPSGPVSSDEESDPMGRHRVGGDRGVAGPHGPYPWLTEDDVADD